MLKMQIIGNIGNDAETRVVNGKKAINFSVAHSEKYTDNKGQKVENTTWVGCTIWREETQSSKIVEFLKKGTKVYCEGRPHINLYKDNQGQSQASLNMMVTNIELLSAKKDEANETNSASGQAQQSNRQNDDLSANRGQFDNTPPPVANDLPF